MIETYTAVIAFITTNVLLVLGIYILGGIVYSFAKWVISLYKLRKLVNKITATDSETIQKQRCMATSSIFDSYEYPPKASNNVGRITVWAIFWPFNLLWTLFADVAMMIWELVLNALQGVYQAVAKAILPK